MIAERDRVAYHEAGHAVAQWLLFHRSFKAISITGGEGCLGHVDRRAPGNYFQPHVEIDGPTRNRLEQEVMVLLAGSASEEIFLGKASRGGVADSDEAVQLLMHACEGDTKEAAAYLEFLGGRVRRMLENPQARNAIESLKLALMEKETLSYREAKAAIAAATSIRDRVRQHPLFGAGQGQEEPMQRT